MTHPVHKEHRHKERVRESDLAFLATLERLGHDWRYSDEFIGKVVRSRYPVFYLDKEREER